MDMFTDIFLITKAIILFRQTPAHARKNELFLKKN